MKYLIGVDEAGRGPLAGPIIVASFCIWARNEKDLNKMAQDLLKFFPKGKIKDSKKLSEKSREEIFKKLKCDKKLGTINFAYQFSSNKVIDDKGLSYAIKYSLKKSLEKIKVSANVSCVLLDGSLKAPEVYSNQKTITKGDEKEAVIALASVVAKVTRDREMVKLSRQFPQYGFEIHKGYGTRFHYEKIKEFGVSEIHRRSFLHKLS